MPVPPTTQDVAIIGMACRFPAADTPAAFWRNLRDGAESITFFSPRELLAAGVAPAVLDDPNYVKAAPILSGADQFDAAFFAYSPKEAAVMDPQHRLFLEVAWEACEDAGYHPETYPGTIGLFAGAGGVLTSYLMAHAGHPELHGQTGGLPHLGNDKDFLATRVAYKLNFTGPAVTVQTACSTSMVAVHLACQSLLSRECDMVLAGASTVRVPQRQGYWIEKGSINSPDGHCRAFDAAAQGTVFGSGVGAVLLKRAEDAVADRDPIYAVIKGTAINNDGAHKVSYTASSVAGQARAMVEALTLAEVSPETLQYVECHGTGTMVGDPLEIQALTRAFRHYTAKRGVAAVGSVKTNLGHLEQTAGLASLMKVALALYHGAIPASLNFSTPNPKIDFERSPFYVNTEYRPWPVGAAPRRAAVNSLGLGGTNAFAVLEAPPELEPALPPSDATTHLFSLSAKSESALVAYAERVGAALGEGSEAPLADVCYTANMSRSQFSHRFAVATDTLEEVRQQLAAFVSGASRPGTYQYAPTTTTAPVVFLFTGQGAQYPGMAAELYDTEPVFRDTLDQCEAGWREALAPSLFEILWGRGATPIRLHETAYAQPALFAVEYALAKLWQSWGVVPNAVMGHSIGELTAACIAGVLELDDALQLVAQRGRLMQSVSAPGAMAAVFAAETVVQTALLPYAEQVAIAAVNSPQNTVVSGDRETLNRVIEALQAQGIPSRSLAVSHAFHSPLMEPILDAFEAVASRISYRAPRLPLVSNVTGELMESAPDARYWRDHLRQPVRFAHGMQTLAAKWDQAIWLEIGPGGSLLSLGQQNLPQTDATWLASLHRQQPGRQTLMNSLKSLYLMGVPIDWQGVHHGAPRRRCSLPTYPFQHQRYWLDPAPAHPALGPRTSASTSHPLCGNRLRSALDTAQFETIYGVEQLPYLADHRIYDRLVLPTTVGLEAAIAAGQAVFGTSELQLHHLTYHEAMVMADEAPRLVQVLLTPQGPQRAAFALLSTALPAAGTAKGRDDWRRHMSGVLQQDPSGGAPETGSLEPFSAAAVQARCLQQVAPEHYYPWVLEMGLDYGPAFQGIQQLWRGDGEALSLVQLPPQVNGEAEGLHPAFLDACLHIYPALAEDAEGPAYLPIGIERFRVYRPAVTEAWVHAICRHRNATTRTLTLDLHLFDTAGSPVAVLEGLSVRRLDPEVLRLPDDMAGLTRWLYQVRWEAQPRLLAAPPTATTEPVAWLLFADGHGVAEALAAPLEQRGDHCHIVRPDGALTHQGPRAWGINPSDAGNFHRLIQEVSALESLPCRGVIYLWGLDLPRMHDLTLEQLMQAEVMGTGGALFLIQALAEVRSHGRFIPKLWIVTRRAQHPGGATHAVEAIQAPLWGLGRVVPLEYPQMWGGLIDIPEAEPERSDDDHGGLLAEILQPSSDEDQVILRRDQRFVARLVPLPAEPAGGLELSKHPEATYLITGGTGMLGLQIAQWLVEWSGGCDLVLTSRRGARGMAREALEGLQASGTRVHVMKADIAVEADVQRVMQAIQRDLPPLRGVVHCAGLLDDGVLSQMDWEKFTRVTAPKMQGGWLLHHYTQSMDLDFFVLSSSILSLTGSAGQANYTAANAFLDALASHRHALGLPAIAINWGPWEGAGLATASGDRGKAIWQARGTQYLPAVGGMRVFEHLMHHPLEHAAVTITDWSVYLEQFVDPPSFYAVLAGQAGTRRDPKRSRHRADLKSQLQQAPPAEHRGLALEALQQDVMEVLGLNDRIDSRQPLNELGLDSLMSVTLVNRLEATLGISVAVAKLVQGPSLEHLADSLFPDLVVPTDTVAGASKTAGDGWLVFPKPASEARVRLFCFPFAGGGAAIYRPWAERVDPGIEIVAIEPPGRASRIHEPPINSLSAFLDAIMPALLPYLDRPFAFFGHCLGGLTLFEITRVLLYRYELAPMHLFVSGARAPHRLLQAGSFEENLLADLLKLDKFDPFLLLHEQPDDVFAEIIRRFNIGATETLLADPELRQLMLPAIRAEFAMTLHYDFQPVAPWDVPITCFSGIDDVYVTRDDVLAWGQYTNSAFRLYMRDGAHFIVVDDASFIQETINRELIAADASHQRFSGRGD